MTKIEVDIRLTICELFRTIIISKMYEILVIVNCWISNILKDKIKKVS